MIEVLKNSYLDSINVMKKFTESNDNMAKTFKAAQLIADGYRNGKKVLICGNGGSNCDALHFAEELTGQFRKKRRALPAIAISESSHITCVGNDYGFDQIFSRGVEAYGVSGDIFIGISTSGNSKNIINAFDEAKKLGLKTILLLGKDGGVLKGRGDIEFIVEGKTSDRIQETHMAILHILIEGVERIIFPELY